jgi:hypothetical protein
MEKLVYFRMLYEYEKQHDVLSKIKEYIRGDNDGVIRDMCAGDLHLPSPFLLDELEWSLNSCDYKIKEIIYQLKITSREFYKSLMDFKSGQYRMHFDMTSISFGQQMICNLEKLRSAHCEEKNMLLDFFKMFPSRLRFFSVEYPTLFRRAYLLCSVLILLVSWYLCISLELKDTALSLLLPCILCAITLMSALSWDHKINIFRSADTTGKNVLAMRYSQMI